MTKEEFKSLFDKHFDNVRQYILYRSGNTELATDVAQETFMKIWEKRMKVDLGKSKGLLFKIANDLFISRYRKEKLTFEFFKNFTINEAVDSPLQNLEFKQLKLVYETALKQMPEKQRAVFLMSRVEGLKYQEIADRLGLSIKAIEKRMKLALDFLRKSIK